MPNILALDTSSDNCSVALYQGSKSEGGQLVLDCQPAPRKHTQLLLPMVQSIVKENGLSFKDLDVVSFGCGPGSFTGIRIAAGVAQGLAYGLDCPIYPVSNLEALALQAYDEYAKSFSSVSAMRVLVAIDARMDEIYWSVCLVERGFDGKLEGPAGKPEGLSVKTILGECVCKPELLDLSSILSKDGQIPALIGCGSGFEFIARFPETVQKALISYDVTTRPKADAICELARLAFERGGSGKLSEALPSYVRDTVTWKKLPGRE